MFDAPTLALCAGLVIATVTDIRSRRIPNELTGAMAVAGLGLAMTGTSGITVWASVAGLLLGLLLMLPGHLLGATGAGDLKLMAAVGAIVGPATVFTAFICTCLAGGVLALVVATKRRRLQETMTRTGRLIAAPGAAPEAIKGAGAASRFAYGPAIAAGSLLAVFLG
jgi:prepilin peptidase CpaA